MKTIAASLGYEAIVDDADYDRLAAYRWYAHNSGSKRHAEKRPARRNSVAEGRKVVFLVHQILRAPEGMVVDHINGDPWDNRRANLRICTHAENLKNQRNRKLRDGLVKGVYARGKRFFAKISSDGARYDLGWYDDIRSAGLAYDAAALFLHGQFASLNYPDVKTEAKDPALLACEWTRAGTPDEQAEYALSLIAGGLNTRQAAEATGVNRGLLLRHAAARGIAAPRGRPRKTIEQTERAA